MDSTSQPVRKKSSAGRLLLAILIVLVLLVVAAGGTGGWYYFYGPCGKTVVGKSIDDLTQISLRWNDATQVAGATSRIGLAGPVKDLQEIERDEANVKVPACLDLAKVGLAASMDNTVNGFISFMSQESDAEVTKHFTTANSLMGNFNIELERITNCAPFCKVRSLDDFVDGTMP